MPLGAVQRNVRVEPAEFRAKRAIESVWLLGVRIDRLRLCTLLDLVRDAARSRTSTRVFYVNVQSVNLARAIPAFLQDLNGAHLAYCDGTGVRIGARIVGMDIPERMTGADWIQDLCSMAEREDLALYLLGSGPGVADEAASALRLRYPALRIVGTAPGFNLSAATISDINHSGADILLVGMGSPRQERWITAHSDELLPPVVWAVGALFAFVSGQVPRGPRWMTEHGLEWVCRLVAEPRKLWRRYLVGNPLFLVRVLRARLAQSMP